jgi:SAM-dependent methyltransferase
LVHQKRNRDAIIRHMRFLEQNTPKNHRNAFSVHGYSYTAGREVDFVVDFQHAGANGGVIWRERVCCPETAFNNRMRAAFHLFDIEMGAYADSEIYLTEQVTPIYSYFASKYTNVVGSEFLRDKVPYGTADNRGIRNETLCALTFPDEKFDILVSLDVIEHIPDYSAAFRECCRVLKPGGKMMWSVPFISNSTNNLVLARVTNGKIEYVLPPHYHGDPLSSEGVLCYTYFGWEMLDQVKEAGFKDAYALCFQSLEFGYLGGEQFLFVANK